MSRFTGSVLLVLLSAGVTSAPRAEETRVDAHENARAHDISHYYVYGDVPRDFRVEAYSDKARVGEVQVRERDDETELVVSVDSLDESRTLLEREVATVDAPEFVELLATLTADRNLARALDGPIVMLDDAIEPELS